MAGRTSKLRVAFAAAAGCALLAWWALDAAGLLGDALAPRDHSAAHIVAEIALGVALLVGAWLHARGRRGGRLALAAGLGALVYACVNVLADYAGEPLMQAALLATCVLAIASLLTLRSGPDG